MKKNYLIFILLITIIPNFMLSQNLTIDETLKYISDNSSTYFNVDSEGFIYNNRYKFHASEVGTAEHMSSAVRIMCPGKMYSSEYGTTVSAPPKCIKCLKKDCYEGTNGGQSSTKDIYIDVDSSYDQRRLQNAISHLIKKVAEKYPKRGYNDPFAR